jgi:hypothetical protein
VPFGLKYMLYCVLWENNHGRRDPKDKHEAGVEEGMKMYWGEYAYLNISL